MGPPIAGAVSRRPRPPPVSPSPATDPPLLAWPLDHFYSPVPDHRALDQEPARSRVWPATPKPTPGIDWHGEDQLALLLGGLAGQPAISFADGPTADPAEYHAANGMFSRLDAWVLQGDSAGTSSRAG